MKRRVGAVVMLLGLVALGIPHVARAEMKLGILEVKGMVCSF